MGAREEREGGRERERERENSNSKTLFYKDWREREREMGVGKIRTLLVREESQGYNKETVCGSLRERREDRGTVWTL